MLSLEDMYITGVETTGTCDVDYTLTMADIMVMKGSTTTETTQMSDTV